MISSYKVFECWNRERKKMVAINNIIRAIKNYRDATIIEIGMLEQLSYVCV
jgi:hypothetical protein